LGRSVIPRRVGRGAVDRADSRFLRNCGDTAWGDPGYAEAAEAGIKGGIFNDS
jgi:hypothetical protein